MPLTAILEIIRLLLEIALIAIKHMPEEEHAEFWKEHRKFMKFWHDMADKARAAV